MRRRVGIALTVALTLAAPPADAASGDAVSVELEPRALKGQGQPGLRVRVRERIRGLRLEVQRGDGRTVRSSTGPLAAGATHRFALPVDGVGTARYRGRLAVRFVSGERGELPIEVEVEVVPPLSLEVARADVDLARRTVRIRATRPLTRVELEITAAGGETLSDVDLAPAATSDGRWSVEYGPIEGEVLRIRLTAYDAVGAFEGLELYPWQVEIPHEDVHFASGAHAIVEAEAPKLEASLGELRAALARYGRLAEGVRLFVAGHTDTVGDAEANLALSRRRARAIAAWFRRQGVRVPIHYAGLGERHLRVATPDETDEPANRRAAYIVAVEPPSIGGQVVAWTRLP